MLSQAKEFCKQTVLHGFGYVVHSTHWIEALLYAILIIVALGMSVQDSIFLFQKYQTDPTKIELRAMHNSSFSLGYPTICFEPKTMENFGGNSFFDNDRFQADKTNRRLTHYTPSYYNQSLVSLKKGLKRHSYNLSDWTEELSDCSWSWANSTSIADSGSLLFYTLSVILSQEALIGLNGTVLTEWLHVNHAETLRQYLIGVNVSFAHVRDFVALLTCCRHMVSIKYAPQHGKVRDLCSSNPRWFGPTDYFQPNDNSPKVCYKVPYEFQYDDVSNYQTIYLKGVTNTIPGLATACHVTMDFAGRRAYFHSQSLQSSIELCQVIQTVKVSISNDVSSLNLPRQPCQDNYDKLECLLKCRLDFFMTNCNCYPISIMSDFEKPPNMPYCPMLSFMNVSTPLNKSAVAQRRLISCLSAQDSIKLCQSKCPAECRLRRLEFVISDVMEANLKNPPRSFIRVSTFDYFYFVESRMYSWSDILMAFGGSIGLWLGGSLIAFVHAIIYALASVLKQIIPKGKFQNSVGDMKVVSSGYPDLKREVF